MATPFMRTYCVEVPDVCIDYENPCVGVHPCFYVYAVYTGLCVCVCGSRMSIRVSPQSLSTLFRGTSSLNEVRAH